MTIEKTLKARSGSACELCTATENLSVYDVSPSNGTADQCILVCENCKTQIEGGELDANHWRCLNDSMWAPVPAVQVMSWRMLKRLESESWAQDLLEMMYLDEDAQQWAEAGIEDDDDSEPTFDSNGARLVAGDTVTLIKDLDVKGANFTAKRGTAVRGISLTSNPEHIEGRVNGVRVVLVAKFLKKSN